MAFAHVNLDYSDFVEVDRRYFRPTEVDLLLGDATKAREKLGWTPTVTFEELVHMMVEADMELAACDKTLLKAGYQPNMLGVSGAA